MSLINIDSLVSELLREKGQQLRPFQITGVDFIIKSFQNGHGAILADEMGLGKTCQTILSLVCTYHQLKCNLCSLIIVPLSVLENWNVELEKFSWNLEWIIYKGVKEDRAKLRADIVASKTCKVLLTTYELIINDIEFFTRIKWQIVVLDEAHRIKNSASIMSESVRELSVKYFLLLTGTPIQNNLNELYSLLCLCDPSNFPLANKEIIVRRWSESQASIEKHVEVKTILAKYMLRRTKETVDLDIPEKQEISLHHSISSLQKKIYRGILLRNRDIFSNAPKQSLMNTFIHLRKCVLHPYLFEGIEPEPFEEGEHLVDASGKLLMLDALLNYLKKTGHKVLLFSQMARMLDIVQDYMSFRGYTYERLDGSVRGEERFAAVSRFMQTDETFVFLLTTRAGGVGLNLTAADTIVFLDSDLNPQMDLQAAARAHRIGQDKPVRIIRMIAKNTLEEYITSRTAKKLKLANSILENDDTQEKQTSWTEMLMFGLSELDKEETSNSTFGFTKQLDYSDLNFEKILGTTIDGKWQSIEEHSCIDNIQTSSTSISGSEQTDLTPKTMYIFEGQDFEPEARQADKAALEAIFDMKCDIVDPFQRGDIKGADNVVGSSNGADGGSRVRKQTVLTNEELLELKVRGDEKKAERALERKEKLWASNNYTSTNLPLIDTSSFTNSKDMKYVRGDVTEPTVSSKFNNCDSIILHCTDNSGKWGEGGVFSAINRRSVVIELGYESSKRMQDLKLGDAHVFELGKSVDGNRNEFIILLITQSRNTQGVISAIKLEALTEALQRVAQFALVTHPGASVHMPRIGFGTHNFNWYGTERIIRKELVSKGIPTSIYYFPRRGEQPSKRSRSTDSEDEYLDTSSTSISVYCENDQDLKRKLERTVAAFGGDVVDDVSDEQVTHIVVVGIQNCEAIVKLQKSSKAKLVNQKWIEDGVSVGKLPDVENYVI